MTKLDFRVNQVVLPTGETHLYLKFYIQGSKLFYSMATGVNGVNGVFLNREKKLSFKVNLSICKCS